MDKLVRQLASSDTTDGILGALRLLRAEVDGTPSAVRTPAQKAALVQRATATFKTHAKQWTPDCAKAYHGILVAF